MRGWWRILLTPLTVLAAGCATTAGDPLEPVNRTIYAFNDGLDKAVLKPVATAYQQSVPEELRRPVTSFFGNLSDAWSAINLLLQGRLVDSGRETMRFFLNSTVGVLGLADVATPLGWERHGEDLGQTLGKWGVGAGPYLVLPFFGPSSLRDVADLPFEFEASPTRFVNGRGAVLAMGGLNVVNTRANLLKLTGMLDDVAGDQYTFVRNAYLQRRRNLVYDGDPPEDDGSKDEEDYSKDPPASPASAATQAASVPAPASGPSR